jgi:GNAT superfamily N-acetyltransferase
VKTTSADQLHSGKPVNPTPEFHAVTPDSWRDLVQLFEHHGNPGYCWCMYWRLRSSEYAKLNSPSRRRALERIIRAGTPVGILGYLDGEPVGWCSIAPRETYARLERSTTIKRIDDAPTWSVVCFFVSRKQRGQHLAVELLRAAVEYARSQGAQIVEGYPVEPRRDADGNLQEAASYNFMGHVSTFRKAGFRDVTPKDAGRRVMRWVVSKGRKTRDGGQKRSAPYNQE